MPSTYYQSPFGVAQHPRISNADTKYNPEGLFHLDHEYAPSAEVEAFVEKVQAEAQRIFEEKAAELTPAERKKWTVYCPVAPQEDDEGNPTGRYIAKYKQNKVIHFKDGTTKEVTISVKDASGKKDVLKPVFGGSELRVMFTMRPTVMKSAKQFGVRLDFAAVQVRKLVTTGSSGGGQFGSVDGYEADDYDPRSQGNFDPAQGPTPMAESDY